MKVDQETKQTTMEKHGGVGHWKKTVAKGDRPKGTATGGTLDTVTRSLTEDLESPMCKGYLNVWSQRPLVHEHPIDL